MAPKIARVVQFEHVAGLSSPGFRFTHPGYAYSI